MYGRVCEEIERETEEDDGNNGKRYKAIAVVAAIYSVRKVLIPILQYLLTVWLDNVM